MRISTRLVVTLNHLVLFAKRTEETAMKMNHLGIRGSFLGLVLTLSLAAAFGQIPNPVLNVQDSPSDTAVQPLVLVQGGSTSSTLGVEVASQSTGTTNGNPLTTLGGIMQTGFGGLSLVQLGSWSSKPDTGQAALRCADVGLHSVAHS